jgi:zona occludens toxin (predicted ATPase)
MPSQQVQRLENSMSRKLFQRVFTLVSIVSFFGSTAYGAIGTISSALKQPKNDATTTSRESKIQSQEKGTNWFYSGARKPGSTGGLVTARLQMQDGRVRSLLWRNW